jgi:hypothetical protein
MRCHRPPGRRNAWRSNGCRSLGGSATCTTPRRLPAAATIRRTHPATQHLRRVMTSQLLPRSGATSSGAARARTRRASCPYPAEIWFGWEATPNAQRKDSGLATTSDPPGFPGPECRGGPNPAVDRYASVVDCTAEWCFAGESWRWQGLTIAIRRLTDGGRGETRGRARVVALSQAPRSVIGPAAQTSALSSAAGASPRLARARSRTWSRTVRATSSRVNRSRGCCSRSQISERASVARLCL